MTTAIGIGGQLRPEECESGFAGTVPASAPGKDPLAPGVRPLYTTRFGKETPYECSGNLKYP